MTPRGAGRPVTLIHNAHHGVMLEGRVLIQVRRGPMSIELVDAISGFARAARLSADGPVAVLSVLEEQAPMPDAAIRKRQNEVIGSMLSEPGARVALVVAGDGPEASLKRAVGRLTGNLRSTQLRIFATHGPAAAWLSAEINASAQALCAAVERMRQWPA